MEWAYNRTDALWDEVVLHKDIPFQVWVGIFSNIMGRLMQASAEDHEDAVEIANEMVLATATIMEWAVQERFGTSWENQWQQ